MVWNMVMRTGTTVRARGMLYKKFAQSVLLHGIESWVVMGAMLKVIEGFHHRVARRITGMTARHTMIVEWEWTPVAEALDTTGICPTKEYIQRRQATVAAQVACRPIYELCTGAERIPGTSWFMKWWDQDVGQEVDLPIGECSFKKFV